MFRAFKIVEKDDTNVLHLREFIQQDETVFLASGYMIDANISLC